jgi:hypothetical protein
MRKCGYRNCNQEIEEKVLLEGSNVSVEKLFCCRKHKEYERKYKKRAEVPPKTKGRPVHIYKKLNELTADDIKKLENIFKKDKNI